MGTGVGIIGCGNISGIYLDRLSAFEQTDVVAVADLDLERAEQKAEEFAIPKVLSVEQLLTDPEVEIVVNLTVPKAHFNVAQAALEAGKHVYNEKPIAVKWEEGLTLSKLAKDNRLLLGCAPDTVLGAGIQTCKQAIEDGLIGEPVAAQGFMMCPGHESWHPDPAFYYEEGGGPLFDMGPYYLTALATLLGPAKRVTGSARMSFPRRLVTSQPKHGQEITVEVPTHLSAVLDYANGTVAQLTTSFDVVAHTLPHLEIYGSEGSLRVPDPNGFGGPVQLWRKGDSGWADIPVVRPYSENSRGLGVLDMALAVNESRAPRANGQVGLHILEIMHAVHWASEQGSHVQLSTTFDPPPAMPSVPF